MMLVHVVSIDTGPAVSARRHVKVTSTDFSKSIGMPGGNDKTIKETFLA